MQKLVECVPNFSEGRNQQILDQIADAIRQVEGVILMDVDPGAATNRTVFTFVGSPETVGEAAFQAIKKASELIDMRTHKGEHARMGATDVCPFIPVSGVTMDDCVKIAETVGERVGKELNIPVYLYENAAKKPDRRNLATVRKGEYEGLSQKLQDPNWQPDFGQAIFNEKSGATAIGAREFLIAYNINLNTRDKKLAHDIALDIRENGRYARDKKGKIVRDENGGKVRKPGLFKEVKAVGWFIEEYHRAQISINFTNYKITPLHTVVDKVREMALERGLVVTGCELVGLTPKEAMIIAGRHYLQKQGLPTGIPEKDIIETAIQSLGLRDLTPFDPDDKIIEYRFKRPEALVNLPVAGFADELSSDSPAPGGGSVAALCGALSAGLSAMVTNLTINKKGYEPHWEALKTVGDQAQALKAAFLTAIDADTDAFNDMMTAMKLPKKTDAEKQARNAAIQTATKNAIQIPFDTMKNSLEAMKLSQNVIEKGNTNALSDGGVAALTALAAIKGAYYNVLINMADIEDQEFCSSIRQQAEKLVAEAEELAKKFEDTVLNRLNS